MTQQKVPHKHADNSASIKVPHIHAELIKQWAEGATIQIEQGPGNWADCSNNQPGWWTAFNYRVKPEPKPDVVMYAMIRKSGEYFASIDPVFANIRKLNTDTCMFIFDGETGALKDCQILAKE